MNCVKALPINKKPMANEPRQEIGGRSSSNGVGVIGKSQRWEETDDKPEER